MQEDLQLKLCFRTSRERERGFSIEKQMRNSQKIL